MRYIYIFIIAMLINIAVQHKTHAELLQDLSVDNLITKLASPNQAPPSTRSPREKFQAPSDYDYEAQENICKAAEEILKRGKVAIPELLKHLEDKRYSISYDPGTGAVRQTSVGMHCLLLIQTLVDARDRRGLPRDLHGWWQEQRYYELWEIQANEKRRRINVYGDESLRQELEKLESTHEAIGAKYFWKNVQYKPASSK